MTDQSFSQTELAALATIAALIIPASEVHGMPGADDPAILAQITRAAEPRRDRLSRALAAVATLEGETPGARGEAFRAAFPAEAGILQTITAECYYRDPRVLRALGLVPRPPFPLGHQVEESDWSLLDPVRAMKPVWREVP
jgi:hypothetical protein